MFGMESLAEMPNPRDLAKIFDKNNPENTKWISFRDSEDGQSQLIAVLRPLELLLVVDNFEHLAGEAELLADLLAAAPRCKLLVTSRQQLDLLEEWVYELQGLPLPTGAPDEENSALALFERSARRSSHAFVLDEANRAAAVQICRLVGGMPLAIELAAGWVRLLSCAEIAAEVSRSLDVLAANQRNIPERHRSMRAVFDYSWRLLSAEEQAALAALSLFAAAIAFRLVAASSLTPVLSRLANPSHWPVYTVLCPVYREAAIVPDLIAAIERLDYPTEALDVKILVEGDDVDTIAAALAMARAPHIEVVIVPPAAPRTKPKALNAGLALARGNFVVVYDAEDRPHPQQLRAALAAFEDNGEALACVQAPLAIDNAEASWIARQFAAEYAIQFGEMLPLLARMKLPLPLGGSSNHFRADALRAVGGWDPYNVREKNIAFAA